MEVWVAFVFEGKAAVTDVVQVLQPLKVGDSHTTSVDVQILQNRRKDFGKTDHDRLFLIFHRQENVENVM